MNAKQTFYNIKLSDSIHERLTYTHTQKKRTYNSWINQANSVLFCLKWNFSVEIRKTPSWVISFAEITYGKHRIKKIRCIYIRCSVTIGTYITSTTFDCFCDEAGKRYEQMCSKFWYDKSNHTNVFHSQNLKEIFHLFYTSDNYDSIRFDSI